MSYHGYIGCTRLSCSPRIVFVRSVISLGNNDDLTCGTRTLVRQDNVDCRINVHYLEVDSSTFQPKSNVYPTKFADWVVENMNKTHTKH